MALYKCLYYYYYYFLSGIIGIIIIIIIIIAGLRRCVLDRLPCVISAATRLTVGARRHDHITPLLMDLR